MPISWKTSDGNTGIAENDYEFAMQHQGKQDRQELPPQERINQAFGEGPTPEVKDQNTPNSWGMDEDMKGLGKLPDAPDVEWEKAYGTKDFHQQLASFQKRLDATPLAEASELQKFFGSLNIMPRPGKPESEWTVKEHLGVMLNTAMAGMGGGIRVPSPGMARGRTPFPRTEEMKTSIQDMIDAGKTRTEIKTELGVSSRTFANLQKDFELDMPYAQRGRKPNTEAGVTSVHEYPHVVKAYEKAVSEGNVSQTAIQDAMLRDGTPVTKATIVKLQQERGAYKNRADTFFDWSEEKLQLARDRLNEGVSYSKIAKELGTTRGAVNGKMFRESLKLK